MGKYTKFINHITRVIILFLLGGLAYNLIEIAYRGRTHYSMFIAGGLCFILIGLLNEFYTFDMSIISQMVIAALTVTIVEYTVGIIFNQTYQVWDYRTMPYNINGQVCLLFTNLWFLLALPAIFLDDICRYILFGESFKKYKIL